MASNNEPLKLLKQTRNLKKNSFQNFRWQNCDYLQKFIFLQNNKKKTNCCWKIALGPSAKSRVQNCKNKITKVIFAKYFLFLFSLKGGFCSISIFDMATWFLHSSGNGYPPPILINSLHPNNAIQTFFNIKSIRRKTARTILIKDYANSLTNNIH